MNRTAIANYLQSDQIPLHRPASIQRFELADQGIIVHFSCSEP